MWAAKNFQEQIKHKYPTLDPLCLTCKNECDTEKLIMTFIKAGFKISYTVQKFQRAYFTFAISAHCSTILPPI